MGAPDSAPPARLASLDAARGFAMIWLLGGAALARELAERASWPGLARHFEHAEWEGFRLFDLIFPLFLTALGAAVPFAVAARRRRGDSAGRILRHALARFGWMCLLGSWVNGNLLTYDPAEFELAYSVLMGLGLGYLVAVGLTLSLSPRGQRSAVALLLGGYCLVQLYAPVPGHEPGVLAPGRNFGDWLNDRLLGDWQGKWRFGLVLMVGQFGASAMLGAFAGEMLRAGRGARLAGWGALLVAAGALWGEWFPIVKDRWTSSFVLFAGGWSYLILAAAYRLVDVSGWRRAALPLVVVGSNSLAAYLIACLFLPAFGEAAEVFVAGLKPRVGEWYGFIYLAARTAAAWLFLLGLYRANFFLKL